MHEGGKKIHRQKRDREKNSQDSVDKLLRKQITKRMSHWFVGHLLSGGKEEKRKLKPGS